MANLICFSIKVFWDVSGRGQGLPASCNGPGYLSKITGRKNLVFSKALSLKKSRFTEFFIRENILDEHGFKEWIFCPGMLFNAPDKWWGDKLKRETLHEGLDLCFYSDRAGGIHRLDKKTKIPVMYDGMVVGIINDFLAKSVIVEHSLSASDNTRFCTIYGHTVPNHGLCVGKVLRQGDIIGTLADLNEAIVNIFSHLHISLGWTSKIISYDKLDWYTIGTPDMLTLLDPLNFMDGRYGLRKP